jgi:hypothetical protein
MLHRHTHASRRCWVLLACAVLPILAHAQVARAPLAGMPLPKQLAGPPEEMPAMRARDPAESAVVSRHALLPVSFAPGQSEAQLQITAETADARVLLLPGPAQWQARLAGASARATASTASRASALAAGAEGYRALEYRFTQLGAGPQTLTLRSDTPGARGYVLVEGDQALELASYPLHRRQRRGERLSINAVLGAQAGDEVRIARAAGAVQQATLRVVHPDGSVHEVPMADDGRHDDAAAGDGRYGASFVPDMPGTWIAQAVVRGADARGRAFVRTTEHVLPVLDSDLTLRAKAVDARQVDGRWQVQVPLQVSTGAGHYRAFAEVWGVDAGGKEVAVAWIGGISQVQDGQLALGLDPRWLQRAGAGAPFTLRRLRIEDPDHFIPLATADTLALSLPAVPAPQRVGPLAIDETMRMGPRPQTAQRLMPSATGARLILVHGYCSSGVWPQQQFSNASSFIDANQNRSHDAFARLLASYGSQWNSFGTVAHSQGGAAALHLYTYYWSGLDNATGARLLQSVGTPYQGTNLAGILATLGNWFGVGCGTNSDMTYDGAAAWLAGIPASARAKVNYYTTSFASTNWYTNDYCNIATDLVLNDPEDGTVEQLHAQLPGAVNRGHTVGQCHTTGMRDPAQYLDAARNATMNANAAR